MEITIMDAFDLFVGNKIFRISYVARCFVQISKKKIRRPKILV